MRKYLFIFAVAVLATAMAMPALAEVQLQYGGNMRIRFQTNNNQYDGTDVSGYYGNFAPQEFYLPYEKADGYYNSNDNRHYFDQRLRLYFSFIGSKNLKIVTATEWGDTTWGDPGDGANVLGVGARAAQNGGGEIGADSASIEIKNCYMEFNIPNTPSTAILGIQSLDLLHEWILADDFSAGEVITKLDPFRVTFGYIGGQNGGARRYANAAPGISNLSKTFLDYTNADDNIDDAFLAVDYNCNPWKASFVFFYQDAHKTDVTINPGTLTTPDSIYSYTTGSYGFQPVQPNIKNNNFYDIGFNLTYKTNSLLAYVNFVKNLGSVEYNVPVLETFRGLMDGGLYTNGQTVSSSDYTGWMLEAGATYYCPPWTFNIGGFYTSGADFTSDVGYDGSGVPAGYYPADQSQAEQAAGVIQSVGGMPFRGTTSTDVSWMSYPLGQGKYTSEIMGGGVLMDDMSVLRGYGMGVSAYNLMKSGVYAINQNGTQYWRSLWSPSNVWTITVGTSYQVRPGTKLSGSFWHWGTSNSVPYAFDPATLYRIYGENGVYYGATKYKMSSDLGNEIDLYLDQKVVDGLTLTVVGAYMFTGDAFCTVPFASEWGTAYNQINAINYTTAQNSDAYKVGARLQWTF